MKTYLAALAALSCIALSACGSSDDDRGAAGTVPDAGSGVPVPATYSNVNATILQPRCVSCHNSQNAQGGVNLESFASLGVVTESDGGALVVAGEPGDSELYQVVQSGRMPMDGTRLPDAQIKLIDEWIRAGAKND